MCQQHEKGSVIFHSTWTKEATDKLTRQRYRNREIRVKTIGRIANKRHCESWCDDKRCSWRQCQTSIVGHPNETLLSWMWLIWWVGKLSLFLIGCRVGDAARLRYIDCDNFGEKQQQDEAPEADGDHFFCYFSIYRVTWRRRGNLCAKVWKREKHWKWDFDCNLKGQGEVFWNLLCMCDTFPTVPVEHFRLFVRFS